MTVVLIPYRPDHGHRDQLWHHIRDNYWRHTGFDVVLGENLDGPFNRSKAVNTAAARDWDIAVIADSDTWVPARQLHHAIDAAKVTGRLVAAFDAVVELSRDFTLGILAGKHTLAGSFGAERVRTQDLETQSSMLVVPRELWDSVGGMDEHFCGWGGEDNAFWKACTLHAGLPERISGNAYHLWHPPAKGKHHGIDYKRNLNRWKRYEAARTIADLQTI